MQKAFLHTSFLDQNKRDNMFTKIRTDIAKEYLEHATFRAAKCADLAALKEIKKLGISLENLQQENGLTPLIAFLLSSDIQTVEERKKAFKFILKNTKDINNIYFDRHARAGTLYSTALDVAEHLKLYSYGLMIKKNGGKSFKETNTLPTHHPQKFSVHEGSPKHENHPDSNTNESYKTPQAA